MCKIPGVSETRHAQGTERKSTVLGPRLSEKGLKNQKLKRWQEEARSHCALL